MWQPNSVVAVARLLKAAGLLFYQRNFKFEGCPSIWKGEGDKTLKSSAKMVGHVHEALNESLWAKVILHKQEPRVASAVRGFFTKWNDVTQHHQTGIMRQIEATIRQIVSFAH